MCFWNCQAIAVWVRIASTRGSPHDCRILAERVRPSAPRQTPIAAQTFYPKIYGQLGASADLDGDGRIDLVFGNEQILFNTCL